MKGDSFATQSDIVKATRLLPKDSQWTAFISPNGIFSTARPLCRLLLRVSRNCRRPRNCRRLHWGGEYGSRLRHIVGFAEGDAGGDLELCASDARSTAARREWRTASQELKR